MFFSQNSPWWSSTKAVIRADGIEGGEGGKWGEGSSVEK
jgi:hypothetical protein